MSLIDRQLTELLEFLPRLYSLHNIATFAQHVVDTLQILIPSDSIGYNQLNVREGRVCAIVKPSHDGSADLYPVFADRIHEHPTVSYQQSSGATNALRLSDFVSVRQFHQLGIYQDFYRKLKIERLLSVSFPDGDTGDQLALVFARSGTDFDDAEMELLNVLRPHFLQAHRNALAFSRLEQADAALQASSHAMVVRCHGDSIRFASPRASNLLTRFFAGTDPCYRKLPDDLSRWARGHRELSATMSSIAAPIEPFLKNHGDAKLLVRFLPGTDEDYAILLEEQIVDSKGERLIDLGLSGRQAEVLHWLARGKTNSEIATILGVTSRTIEKHVEHIFDRLGVENRMAAGVIAWRMTGAHSF
ncbi:MAG TPA: helix-turn-helix transcriptional regulator [Candidatus Binataceae bacterium]|nr:helix-turn-helix transcriptional regulator [Candidatus Binataceae bacterium]